MAVERVEVGPYATHWSAILAGSFVAVGCWLFLFVLGGAIGALAREAAGVWTAIYTVVAPIVALFAGGLVASRSRWILGRADAALHALVVWGFTMVLGALLFSLLGLLVPSIALQRMTVPSGYAWAVAGSIFGAAVAAILGATIGLGRRVELGRREEAPREARP
ncbi:MAG: hypothetical protein HYZ28_04565 [Myxococcales bacterium]|nr:hypothetical protein [Myxococcales bacterium]